MGVSLARNPHMSDSEWHWRRQRAANFGDGLYATPQTQISPNGCIFYHTMDLPDHGVVDGRWDLRGKEAQYLGVTPASFRGKTVLEIGPASGGLTFWMEKQGADVVALDMPENFVPEHAWDVPECQAVDIDRWTYETQGGIVAMHDSWWFAHHKFKSKARIHYGSAYAIPDALGRFDTVTLGVVLLHNKSPHLILEQAARRARDTLIVVEILPLGEDSVSDNMIFVRNSPGMHDGWFQLPPALTERMLKSMGFTSTITTFHSQVMDGKQFELYTVVARR